MSDARHHLDRLRARRLHTLVQQRSLNCGIGSTTWADYKNLAGALSHLLRHNGLEQTVAYLEMLAAPNGRASNAAGELVADWLQSSTETDDGWHLQSYSRFTNSPDDRAAYRQASRLALREADWLRRFVQSVPLELAEVPAAAGSDEVVEDD